MTLSSALPSRALVQENEISGLIEWSLPWVKAVACVSILIGVQGLGFAVIEITSTARETFLWHLLFGSAGLTLAYCLLSFARKGARFITSSDDKLLGDVMSELNVVLSLFFLTLSALVFSVWSDLADAFASRQSFHWSAMTYAFSGIAVLGGPLVAFSCWKAETHACYAKQDFLKQINPFASRLLPALRLFSVSAIAAGVMTAGFGIADYLYDITGSATRVIGSGIVLSAFGGAFQWYRRAVRDIQRNPTPYFLERTLNRLNLFWLLSLVLFSALFVVSCF